MKRPLLTLFFVLQFILSTAQDKLAFKYDTAGNQISRQRICLNCTPSVKASIASLDSIPVVAIEESKLLNSKLTTYPNPVIDELALEWVDNPEKLPSKVQLNSFDGRVLYQLVLKEKQREQTIDFSNYSSGVYVLTVYYTNGKKETIKIIKK